ncbi:DUF3570 domain-containing protein [Marinibactrum halimedae]|nr:DUF3570 domain-containing protein [Marinibactrum halimedae]MCD9459636.1 DUF3570 domain-containing protein [Marinibactrum halimedae]
MNDSYAKNTFSEQPKLDNPAPKNKKQSRTKNTSHSLAALTAAALALPGMDNCLAIEPTEGTTVAFQQSRYVEGDQKNYVNSVGENISEGGRMSIDISQLDMTTRINDNLDLSIKTSHEVLSGASPWFIAPGADGEAIQVMSGASIEEQRTDISSTVGIYNGRTKTAIGVAYSQEDDYTSRTLSSSFDIESKNKMRTFSIGVGYSDDTVEPVDTDQFSYRIESDDRSSIKSHIGWTEILSKNTVIQANLGYTHNAGFLSDPYKLVWVGNAPVADSRPEKRDQFTQSLRLRHHLANTNSTLHADYRYFSDDWGIDAHTFNLGLYQNLPNEWQVSGNVRLYSQSRADFYSIYFTDDSTEHHSSDYRLSAFGSISTTLSVQKTWQNWLLNISAEHYESDRNWSHKRTRSENPGLVNFQVISAGLNYQW